MAEDISAVLVPLLCILSGPVTEKIDGQLFLVPALSDGSAEANSLGTANRTGTCTLPDRCYRVDAPFLKPVPFFSDALHVISCHQGSLAFLFVF